MINRQFQAYIASYRGLSREIWLLSLITLINRAGTMVIPFLSLYLTVNLGFSIANVGWIMTCFGLGSVLGAWTGGQLTDRIGFYYVMLGSLFLSGIIFILLQYITSFDSLCLGVFVLTFFADMFRPAMYVSIKAFSTNANTTRSLTLTRLAINLGFSVGPAVGGFLIATMGYNWLFWVDGVTCISAALLLMALISYKSAATKKENNQKEENLQSAYSDRPYLLFLFIIFLTGVMFLQLFSTYPTYLNSIHKLSEVQIGWLIALNGMLIFLFEMPLVNYLEKTGIKKTNIIWVGILLIGFGFGILNIFSWSGVLIISMLFLTIGEMLAFPFANSFAIQRSSRGKSGEYMALFPITFSLAHIVGPNLGMQLVDQKGYSFTWYTIFSISLFACFLCYFLMRRLGGEKHNVN
jgi:predicted MFS family arabinose efflux permease